MNEEKTIRHWEEAIKECNKAISFNPNSAEAYNNRGLAKFELGQYEEAIKDYDEAIRLSPNPVAFPLNHIDNIGKICKMKV